MGSSVPERYRIRPLRRVEYDHLVEEGAFEDERLELLDGALISGEPQSPFHAGVVNLLAERLREQLGGRAQVRTEQPLASSDTSEPEPDVAVVPVGRYLSSHPDRAFFVAEISESSLRKDCRWKAALYASAGTPEYWVVDLAKRRVIVHRDPRLGRWRFRRAYGVSATLKLGVFPDVRIRVRELFEE